jgi:hypothetical protein
VQAEQLHDHERGRRVSDPADLLHQVHRRHDVVRDQPVRRRTVSGELPELSNATMRQGRRLPHACLAVCNMSRSRWWNLLSDGDLCRRDVQAVADAVSRARPVHGGDRLSQALAHRLPGHQLLRGVHRRSPLPGLEHRLPLGKCVGRFVRCKDSSRTVTRCQTRTPPGGST